MRRPSSDVEPVPGLLRTTAASAPHWRSLATPLAPMIYTSPPMRAAKDFTLISNNLREFERVPGLLMENLVADVA
jgi:hypothetical protein